MPSLVRRGRVALEWALRALALALLAAALWRTLRPTAPAGATRVAAGAQVDAALARWTLDSAARDLAVRFDSMPGERARDWLAALAHAGRRVRWQAAGATPVAIVAEPLVAPQGGTRVRVAGAAHALALSDAGGLLDTLQTGNGPAALVVAGTSGALAAHTTGVVARATAAPTPRIGRVLVLGRAGWETKFVVAALEEAGWTVDARVPLAPGVRVTQGSAAAPDTARDAAVVALDSSALALVAPDAGSSGSALAAFVRSGGGLVLAGEAATVPALASLAAGTAGPELPGIAGALATDAPRRALAVRPIVRPRMDAVPIESRGTLVTAAARRVGAGRVVQIGYVDSWRWRMEGDDDAPAAHRAWWSSIVSSVAYAPIATTNGPSLDGAPLAHTIDVLGPPSAIDLAALPSRAPDAPPLPLWMLTLSLAALLAEWASRRLRGAR